MVLAPQGRGLSFLVIEDSPYYANLLEGKLRRTFPSATVEVRATRPGHLESLLTQQRFSAVFIDLVLQQTGPPIFEGVDLARDVRKLLPEAVIVVYSASLEEGEEARGSETRRTDCLEAGADAVTSRSNLFGFPEDKLKGQLDAWAQTRLEKIAGARPVDFADDRTTRAAVDVVGGEPWVRRMVAEVIGDAEGHRIKALSPGRSGAVLFKVVTVPKDAPGERHLVIKADKSDFALEAELGARPAKGTWQSAMAVGLEPGVHRIDDWYVAWMEFLRDAQSLREYVTGSDVSSDVRSTLQAIAEELLERNAADAAPSRASFGIGGHYRLRDSAGLAVIEQLDAIASWSTVLGERDLEIARRVKRFVEASLDGVFMFSATGKLARLHGDLHCRNVFLRNGRPVVIDFARSDVYPRLFDFASLETDLALAVADAGEGHDQRFDRLDAWESEFVASSLLLWVGKADAEGAPTRREVLQRLMRRSLSRIGGLSEREYGEVLLFNILRYLRFDHVTAPKRVLAARWAHSLIERLGLP